MNNKAIALLCLASAIAGGALVRHFMPVVKTVTETKEVVTDRVTTITKEVDKPDGTKTITTKRTDAIVENKDTVQTKVDVLPQPQWRISGGYNTNKQYYGVVDRRILGPVFIGISATSGGTVGAHIGFEF